MPFMLKFISQAVNANINTGRIPESWKDWTMISIDENTIHFIQIMIEKR